MDKEESLIAWNCSPLFLNRLAALQLHENQYGVPQMISDDKIL